MTDADLTAIRADVVVVGAGIVGLASALRLLERHPGLRVTVIDKERIVAAHQTGHNSGVIHRGVYYAPGSLKAILCAEGARELTRFCDEQGVAYRLSGKLVVAVDETELPALDELHQRSRANGVPGAELVGPERIREIEPHAAGIRGLHSPQTGIVDYRVVAETFAHVLRQRGAEIRLGAELLAVHRADGGLVLETSAGELPTRHLVACAGLQADRVLRLMGERPPDGLRIVPFRGDYHVLRRERADLVRSLIYPVPDPRFPFLGVHLSRRLDGEVWAGPNAVPAFAREGYRRRDVRARDLAGTVVGPGFLRLARRYWRTGLAEMWRDVSRGAFAAAVRRYLPELRDDDLLPGPSGVRAQAMTADGTLVDDFVVSASASAVHVLNAPSPAATSSLAIARLVAERAEAAFGL